MHTHSLTHTHSHTHTHTHVLCENMLSLMEHSNYWWPQRASHTIRPYNFTHKHILHVGTHQESRVAMCIYTHPLLYSSIVSHPPLGFEGCPVLPQLVPTCPGTSLGIPKYTGHVPGLQYPRKSHVRGQCQGGPMDPGILSIPGFLGHPGIPGTIPGREGWIYHRHKWLL